LEAGSDPQGFIPAAAETLSRTPLQTANPCTAELLD